MRISRRKGLLLAGIVLIGLSLLLITSSPFQQWLLRKAERYAADAGFPFTAERLHLNLTKLRASVDGFTYDKNGQRIRVKHVLIDLPWNAFRGEGVHITNIEADGVVVDIQSTENSETSGKSTAAGPAGTKPPDIRIDHLAIRNASLTYSTPKTTVRIPSFSLEAINGRGNLRLHAPVSIGAEASVTAAQVPFVLDNESAQFGPLAWKVHYAKYDSSGSVQGIVRWSPALALDANVSTDPLTIEKWKDIRLNAKASYANGTFDISEFRATQPGSEIAGSARISDAGTSANVAWKDVKLDPSGFVARTDGTLNLTWKRSDLGDLSGSGSVSLTSPQYGTLQSDLRIAEAQAVIDARANAADLAIRGQVAAGLEPLLRGSLNGLRGTARASIQPLRSSPLYQKVETVNISAAAMFRDNELVIREIRAASRGSSVSGATLQVNLKDRSIRGTAPAIRLDLHDFAPNATGTVSLSADIAGSFDQPTASVMGSSSGVDVGSIHADNIKVAGDYADGLHGVLSGTVHPFAPGTSYPGLSAIDISASATFRDNVLAIRDVDARANASHVSDASLEMNLTNKQVRGNVPTIEIDLSDFDMEAAGVVKMAADIGGTLDQPTAFFAGSSAGLDIGGTHIDTVGLEGRYENDTLMLTQLEARQGAGVLNATGSVNLATEAVNAEARIADLKVVQVADLTTTAFVKAQAGGTYRSPNIDFSGELRDIIYRQVEHGTVQVDGSTNLKTATVRAKSEKYAATVAGDITLQQPYPFTATLTSNDSRLRYDTYEMVADGKIRVSGEAEPFKGNNVEFDEFKLRGEGITLSANGSTTTGAKVDMKVDLADLPLEDIDLGGTAQVSATVKGSLNDPSIEGTLTTDNATARVMQMTEPANLSARVDFTGNEITIRTLQAEYAKATATLTGNGTWKGTGHLEFQIANVRPENFLKDQQATGIANAEGELDIKSPRIEDISGQVKVTELDVKVREIGVHQTQPIEVTLDQQVLTVRSFEVEGLETHASIKGQANLRDQTLNFDADANTDLAILEPLIPNSHPSGRMETRIALRGTTEKPDLNGFVNLSDGGLTIENPLIELTDLNLEAQLHDDRIELRRADGKLNEGKFSVSGGTALSASGLRDAAFGVKVERGQLEYPAGLQSEFSSELALEGSMPNLTLRGTVDVLNAIYQKDLKLSQTIFARITAPPPPSSLNPTTSTGLSSQIRMEVEVRAENGKVIVKNDVADLEAAGTFQVRGTVANPVILGRARVLEGGELYFGPSVSAQAVETSQRADRYSIERGSIDFNNPLRTEPELDFVATHELEVEEERYIVTLQISGTPDKLKPEFTSDPHLEQQDIVTMLLTGRTFEDLQGTYGAVAGEQALSYLSGQLSSRVLSQAGNVVGLDTVRIDPVTVASQTDVAARLTLAKDFTQEFGLVYSQTLNDTEAQTWIAAYKPFKRFVVRGINDGEQNEVLLDLKHELRLGGGDPLLERTRPLNEVKLRKITFTGTSFSEKDLRKQVTKEGSPFGTYHSSQDVRNLRRFLASQGYPFARIQAQQNTQDRNVDVEFDITQGPKILLAYEGADVPEKLRKEIEQVWTLRSSDVSSQRESIRRILRHFRSDGYLEAQVSAESSPSDSPERRYVFKVVPGFKFDKPGWVFNGIEPMNLHDPAGVVMENPVAIKEQIESTLRSDGYLEVKSTEPKLVIEGSKAHFEVMVERGMVYTVKDMEFEGNSAIEAQRLREIVTTEASKKKEAPVRFTSEWLEAARQGITTEYWKRGYNDVQIVPSTTPDPSLAQTTVRFAITEGELQIIEGIEVTGAKVTSRAFIERQFQIKKGDPVDLTKVNLTRKKLYDTRLFKRVETQVVQGTNGYVTRIHLTENAPWQVRYGVSVTEHLEDGDRSVGVSADLSYNNLLGRAITTGVSGKWNTDEKDGRVFASSPQLFGRRVVTSMTFFRTQDTSDSDEVVDYWGTTAQQQWRIGEHYLFSYDYSYRKVLSGGITESQRQQAVDEDILDNIRVPIARFGIVLSRDTRDDILNATRGHFISNSFEIAPPNIGSSVEFYRNFSQYFHFQPYKKFVFASAIRFGVAKSIEDEPLDPSLLYKSGGGSTVRAFKQDELTREGGLYEFVVNQEFRFPLFWKFSGVAFVDAGQVALQSKNILNLRWGPGLGIRIQTPFVLLRIDLGINISPRPKGDGSNDKEDRGRWSFGIGQAF
jgi:outer membrane protein assembly factor BamA/autotransporter translocation and assembly factor TamB